MRRSASAGIRLSTFSAIGVNRRILRSALTMTMAIWTLPRRLMRSLFTRLNSSLRPCNSSLTVFSSSLVDCNSSFAVSSSSFVLCSSSLLERTSSLADCSSSFAASSSWMTDCRYSRLTASSRSRKLHLRLGSPPAHVCPAFVATLAPNRGGGLLPLRVFLEQHQVMHPSGCCHGNHIHVDTRPAFPHSHLEVGLAHGVPRLPRGVD